LRSLDLDLLVADEHAEGIDEGCVSIGPVEEGQRFQLLEGFSFLRVHEEIFDWQGLHVLVGGLAVLLHVDCLAVDLRLSAKIHLNVHVFRFRCAVTRLGLLENVMQEEFLVEDVGATVCEIGERLQVNGFDLVLLDTVFDDLFNAGAGGRVCVAEAARHVEQFGQLLEQQVVLFFHQRVAPMRTHAELPVDELEVQVSQQD